MNELHSTLSDLIRINSVNVAYPEGPGEGALAEYVEAFFRQRQIQVWRQPVLEAGNGISRPVPANVIACIPGQDSNRRLLLEAHMDTVSVERMAIPPWQPDIREGRIYGRGACDTKGGMAAMMHAVADWKSSGTLPPIELWFAAVVDEEHGATGIAQLCQGLKADGAIVAEPTELRAVIAHKGVLRFRIRTRGKAAHSSKVHLGKNAIHHMAQVVLELERDHDRLAQLVDPLLGSPSSNVGRIYGGVQINFVPDECVIELDRRLLPAEAFPSEEVARVLAHYQTLWNRLKNDDPTMEIEMEPPLLIDPPLFTSPESQVAKTAVHVLKEMGCCHEVAGVPYGSDASKLSLHGVPSIVFGPGSIDQAHAAIEYVDLAQVDLARDFYHRFIQCFPV